MNRIFLFSFVFLMLLFGCKKREVEPKWRLNKITQKLNNEIVTLFEFTGLSDITGINLYPELGTSVAAAYLCTLNYKDNKLYNTGIRYKSNQANDQNVSYTYNADGLLIESTTDYLSTIGGVAETRKAFFEYHSSRKLKLKSFNSYLFNYEYDFEGNLIKATLDSDSETKVYEISFDHHSNPFYGIPLEYIFEATGLWGLMSLSKRQITSIKYTEYYNGKAWTSYNIYFDYKYDDLNRPLHMKQSSGKNTSNYQEYSYYYQ